MHVVLFISSPSSVHPVILSFSFDAIGIATEQATLQCSVFASPRPNITWLRDNSKVDLSDPLVGVQETPYGSFQLNSTLLLSNLAFNNSGDYVCRGSNDLVSPLVTDSAPSSFTVNSKLIHIYYTHNSLTNQLLICTCTC